MIARRIFIGAGLAEITIGTATSAVSGTNGTSFTFSSQGIGDAAANRMILIGVGVGGGSAGNITGVTVGGASATLLKAGTIDGETRADIYAYAIASGTTANIVVNAESSKGFCGIVVLPVYGASVTPVDTAFSNANPGTDTIDVSAGGLVFGYQIVGSGTDRTFTWTNLDELIDETVETANGTHSAAATIFSAADTGKTITCTPSGSTGFGENMVAVSLEVA